MPKRLWMGVAASGFSNLNSLHGPWRVRGICGLDIWQTWSWIGSGEGCGCCDLWIDRMCMASNSEINISISKMRTHYYV